MTFSTFQQQPPPRCSSSSSSSSINNKVHDVVTKLTSSIFVLYILAVNVPSTYCYQMPCLRPCHGGLSSGTKNIAMMRGRRGTTRHNNYRCTSSSWTTTIPSSSSKLTGKDIIIPCWRQSRGGGLRMIGGTVISPSIVQLSMSPKGDNNNDDESEEKKSFKQLVTGESSNDACKDEEEKKNQIEQQQQNMIEKGDDNNKKSLSLQWNKFLTTMELQWITLYDKLLSLLPQPISSTITKIVKQIMDFLPTLRTIGLSFIAGAAVAVAAVIVPLVTQVDKFTEPVTLFETILADLDRGYVDSVDTEKLFETGVSAMLRSLDPYTEFEGRKEANEMQESISGKYGGVGLVISGRERKKVESPAAAVSTIGEEDGVLLDDDDDYDDSIVLNDDDDNSLNIKDVQRIKEEQTKKLKLQQKPDEKKKKKKVDSKNEGIRVVSAFEGYAFDAGMRVGDRILAVDDFAIQPDTTVEDVRNKLRGDPGTTVAVSFIREGVEGIQTLDVPRQIVKIHDVKAATMIGSAKDGIGYIQLNGFSQDAGAEMRAAITSLQRRAEMASEGEQSLTGLILDLRQNPGGLLTSAVDVSSLFVPKNADIVSARGRGFPSVLYRSRVDPLVDPSSTKLVVLVSANTASAAEIVSGAVQDLDVGVILGNDRTYGKGLVQNVEELPFETALKFTVAKYYTPSGRCIQSTNYIEGGGLEAEGASFRATKVEEKDKSEYYTTTGRTVKDGGGIEADVKVSSPKASALEVTLLRNNLMNEYASDWSKQRTNELTNNKFEVTDEMYADFQRFVMTKQNNGEIDLLQGIYSNPLDALKKTLKQSGYRHSLNKELQSLQTSILNEMKADFIKYRNDIKEDIEQSILARYIPESMLIARSIKSDVQVNEAVKLIRNDDRFNGILARNYNNDDANGGGYGVLSNNVNELAKMEKDGNRNGGRLTTGSLRVVGSDPNVHVNNDNEGAAGVKVNVKW